MARETYAWPIAVLSGGQVTRALLAKLLLQEPDLLVLDEPTNYLDLAALEWLESYLAAWPHSLLVVSHDRYFLDHVVNAHLGAEPRPAGDLSRQLYALCACSARIAARARRRVSGAARRSIAKTEEFIRRYKAGQRSKQARGPRDAPGAPGARRGARSTSVRSRLRLRTTLRSGDKVLDERGRHHRLYETADAPMAQDEAGEYIALSDAGRS